VTRAIAFEHDAWTPVRKAEIAAFFDSVALGWRDRDVPERHDALHDAVARGGPFPSGWCAEIGCGTGNVTSDLRATFTDVVSFDLSREMLRLAPFPDRKIQSDSAQLPLRTGSMATVALVNMFLFPLEVDRLLAPDGVLLWVSTNGDETPIHLRAADVLDALPGTWDGVTADAGWGTWLTARRTAPTANA
jgi:SAM-dependent methyltransferase